MLLQADALRIPLRAQSVHCVVTSPPYWGLRDYGVTGQLGREPTPDAYIANMVAVFREVWRVLRDDGTLWLNVGDSYAAGRNGRDDGGRPEKNRGWAEYEYGSNQTRKAPPGLKPKDLVGIPWRLALALQADGWYLRSDIIWSKPNPMPESVTDRPTKAHEYLFLLSKNERYYYDQQAIDEPSLNEGVTVGSTRNRRSVWTIATEPYAGAHFATFPPALIEPCIRAGTSAAGVCPHCGRGWVRVVELSAKYQQLLESQRGTYANSGERRRQAAVIGNGVTELNKQAHREAYTVGWRPACTCPAADPVPALVFDPFVGSGTTVATALHLGRRGVGLDLSRAYLTLAQERTQLGPLAAWNEGRGIQVDEVAADMPLFAGG